MDFRAGQSHFKTIIKALSHFAPREVTHPLHPPPHPKPTVSSDRGCRRPHTAPLTHIWNLVPLLWHSREMKVEHYFSFGEGRMYIVNRHPTNIYVRANQEISQNNKTCPDLPFLTYVCFYIPKRWAFNKFIWREQITHGPENIYVRSSFSEHL